MGVLEPLPPGLLGALAVGPTTTSYRRRKKTESRPPERLPSLALPQKGWNKFCAGEAHEMDDVFDGVRRAAEAAADRETSTAAAVAGALDFPGVRRVSVDSFCSRLGDLGVAITGTARAVLAHTFAAGANDHVVDVAKFCEHVATRAPTTLSGKPEYVAACAAARIVPSRVVLRRIGASRFCARHGGLDAPQVAALAAALPCNTTIADLVLAENKIGDRGAKALAAALRVCGSDTAVAFVDVSGCGVGRSGVAALASACRSHGRVRRLDVSRNTIGDRGGVALGRELANLVRLDASKCEIGARGGDAIGAGAAEAPLERLDLSYNPLRAPGALPVLRQAPASLLFLDLAFCGLDDACGGAVADALRRLPRLETFGCDNNRLGHASGLAIAEALREAPALSELRVGFQRLGTAASLEIARSIGAAARLTALRMENTCAAGAEVEVAEAAEEACGGRPVSVTVEYPPRVRNLLSRERDGVATVPARMREKLKPLLRAGFRPAPPRTPKAQRRRRWRLPTSIWRARPRECDSRTFFDVDRFLRRVADADVRATRIEHLLDGDTKELKRVSGAVGDNFRELRVVFRFYCCLGNEEPFAMPSAQWLEFVDDVDLGAPGMKREDVDIIFRAANVEVGGDVRGNPDRALTRYEFVECLYRIAQRRYNPRGAEAPVAPADALRRLLEVDVLPECRAHAEAYVDAGDAYRRGTLYTEAVEKALRRHEATIAKMWDRYAKPTLEPSCHGPVVDFGDAMRLLRDLRLFDGGSPLTIPYARRAFVFSQMTAHDTVASKRSRLLTYTDFLEFLCRCAGFDAANEDRGRPFEDLVEAFFHRLENPPGDDINDRSFCALNADPRARASEIAAPSPRKVPLLEVLSPAQPPSPRPPDAG